MDLALVRKLLAKKLAGLEAAAGRFHFEKRMDFVVRSFSRSVAGS
jgi:hypothetical protein